VFFTPRFKKLPFDVSTSKGVGVGVGVGVGNGRGIGGWGSPVAVGYVFEEVREGKGEGGRGKL